MSVLGYLQSKASSAVLSRAEQDSITTSINTIRTRLDAYFGSNISHHFRFGSSTRGTILPRVYDSKSDIDYMVVFSEAGYQPQTYLNRLKSFAEYYYNSSTIKQSSPTIVLELNHIKFDLVPALPGFMEEYRIPNAELGWLGTSPKDFNQELTEANRSSDDNLKPAIRLIKMWNAARGYVFDSYSLEKHCASRGYWFCSNLKHYFYSIVESLPDYIYVQWRREAVARAKQLAREAREFEQFGDNQTAERKIAQLIS